MWSATDFHFSNLELMTSISNITKEWGISCVNKSCPNRYIVKENSFVMFFVHLEASLSAFALVMDFKFLVHSYHFKMLWKIMIPNIFHLSYTLP